MKRVLAVFLFLVILCLFAGCQLNEKSNDNSNNSKDDPVMEDELDAFEYEEVSGGLKITKYVASNTKIVVPEVIDNKKVVSVGSAFSGNLSIEEVELPSSVKKADFKNCEALKRLEAKGISSITEINLSGCESLEYLALPAVDRLPPNGWNQLPNSIRELVLPGLTALYVYQFPSNLSSLEILDISSVTFIKRDYYSWPSKLKEVKVSDLITKYYISDDIGTVGCVLESGVFDDSEVIDITENNKSLVWCELFSCEEIKVNDVTHRKD